MDFAALLTMVLILALFVGASGPPSFGGGVLS